jgi:hypothetical protein
MQPVTFRQQANNTVPQELSFFEPNPLNLKPLNERALSHDEL